MKRKQYSSLRKSSVFLLLQALLIFSVYSQPANVKEVEERMLSEARDNIEQFRKGDVTVQFVDENGKPITNVEVEVVQETHDFLFGCIIFDLMRGDKIYREELFKQRFKGLFNFAIFPFYWPGYERQQGMPQWEKMLPVIDWCKANGITTKGHPLVWACRSGVPLWLAGYPVDETEELSKARVTNIVRGFKDKIDIWDVVNEPVNVKTWRHKIENLEDEHDWGVKDEIQAVTDYVEDALQWTNSANPKATLIINEFNTIALKDVRTRFDELLKELESREAPISGIGIQAHEPRQEWYPPEAVWETFDLYAKYGHPIHITELHPQSSGVEITGGWRTGKWTSEAQTEFTEQFVRLCFGHPSVASINWWGFSDRNIWLPGGGLVDEEYQPKPVYNMLDKLINEEWRSNLTAELDGEGRISFRGFYGKYVLKIKSEGGKVQAFPFHVRKDEENKWVFTSNQ